MVTWLAGGGPSCSSGGSRSCYVVAPQATAAHPDSTTSGVGTLPLDLFLQVVGAQAEAALATNLEEAE